MTNDMMQVLMSTVVLSGPLILAALGGLFSERSGVINIALEGKMLGAACTAVFIGAQTGSPLLSLIGALGAAVIIGLIHAVLTQVYNVDHIISGMGLNASILGATTLFAKTLPQLQTDEAAAIFPSSFFWTMAFVLAGAAALYIARTRGGLHLLAVGNDPDKSRQMGLNPVKIRFKSLAVAGLLCGLSGALIASTSGNFVPNMTDGRGYIALAALILGGWRAIPALLACLLFGFFHALELMLQGQPILGVDLPPELWQSLPYAAALIALALFAGHNKAPAGLGRP
jgi:simple sugar transport system permease protein